MRRLAARLVPLLAPLLTAAGLVPLVVLGPSPASAQEVQPPPPVPVAPAPAPPAAEPLLSGTIDGEDGRAVNALLGFDWLDAMGRRLGRDGCVQSPACPLPSYGTVVRVNPGLPATGSPETATATTTFSVQPPPGARRLMLEVYPQNERFRTDEARYGHAMRHSVALPHLGPLTVRLPLVDCLQGGRVGTLRGTATRDGVPFPLRRVVVWSLDSYDPVLRPVLGWNIGTATAEGTFEVPNLVGEQRYQVWVTAADGTVRKTFGVRVPACAEARLDLRFDTPPPEPDVPPPPPAPVLPAPVVTVGQSAVVEGAAAPGAVVQLLAATRPDTALRLVRTTTAAPSGHYAFTVTPAATTELRVRTAGSAPGAPALLQVRSAVSASYARTAARTYRVSGGVRPARAQEVGLYLRTPDGGRRLLARARTGPDGRYALSRRFLVPGTFPVLVTTTADALNAEGRTPVTRLRVG